MFATGETAGLAEWIIDDTCHVLVVSVQTILINKVILRSFLQSLLTVIMHVSYFYDVS